MYGEAESNADRRERLRKLALETIDLAKVCTRPSVFSFSHNPGSIYFAYPSWYYRMQALFDVTPK